jgi:hypothetical protein
MHGEKAREDYINLFKAEKPETNIPKLQIFSHCTELIKTIPILVYDERHNEDVKKTDGDDPYDALRYGLKAVSRYFHFAKSKFEVISKKQEIINTSANINDMIMRMRVLESKDTPHTITRHKNRGFYGGKALSRISSRQFN